MNFNVRNIFLAASILSMVACGPHPTNSDGGMDAGMTDGSMVNNCESNPCLNGGTCNDNGTTFVCTCPSGFTGTTCGTNVNDCTVNSCNGHGTCVDGVNTFTCTCAAGYHGTTCAASTCGDGIVAGNEQCDLGTANNNGMYNGCNANCTMAAFCGDGIVNGTEECDDSNPDNCTNNCKFVNYICNYVGTDNANSVPWTGTCADGLVVMNAGITAANDYGVVYQCVGNQLQAKYAVAGGTTYDNTSFVVIHYGVTHTYVCGRLN